MRARHYSIILLIAVSFVVDCSTLLAAPATYVKLGNQEKLDKAGIKIRLFKDMISQPLPSVNRIRVTNTQSSETFKTYSLYEMWFQSQAIGFWRNSLGFILIGEMTLMPPDKKHMLVTKEFYEEWEKSNEITFKKETISGWLSAFSGLTLEDGTDVIKKQKNQLIVEFHEKDPAPDSHCSLFVLKNRYGGKTQYFAVIYRIAKTAKLDKSLKTIRKSIESVDFFAPTQELAAKSKFKGKKVATEKRADEYAEDRERVIHNIKNLKDWWYTETDNYLVVSNLKTKKDVELLQNQLEKSRAVFEAVFPQNAAKKAVSVVKVFNSRDGYVNYVGQDYKWTGGVWLTQRNELAISPVDDASRRENRDIIARIVNHEGFHQFLFYALKGVRAAPWFNEGHASFFEGVEFKRGSDYQIGTTDRLKILDQTLDYSSKIIPSLLKMDYTQFYFPQNRDINYTYAWALIYFLQKGSRVIKNRNTYYEIPDKYFDSILKDKNADKANEEAWENIDMSTFIEDFKTFWSSKKLIKKSERLSLQKEKK